MLFRLIDQEFDVRVYTPTYHEPRNAPGRAGRSAVAPVVLSRMP